MPLFRTTVLVEKKDVINWSGWVNGTLLVKLTTHRAS
jgi:hypothetical protein